MTADLIDVTARVLARACGRAIPIRRTSAISADPPTSIGIAPIRMAAEELVQAIAFGPIDSTPRVAVRWNPLSRDPGQLGVFATALEAYISGSLAAGQLPRIWLPHSAALEVLDLLGHRMRRNSNATPDLQRMGSLCRAIAVESEFPDQQIVAVAGDLLRTHLVTGQSPKEDGHVGAVVAWVTPPPGVDPLVEASRRSLMPANAMMQRHIDDEVERLRKIGKGKGLAATAARSRIEQLLSGEALREWELLVEARNAFLSLNLPEAAGLGYLVTSSLERFRWAAVNDPSTPSHPVSLRRRLQAMEVAARRVEDVDARSDARVRERLRRQGRVIAATVAHVVQPSRRRRPTSLYFRTDQAVLRIRIGTVVQTEDRAVKGRVTRIEYDFASGSRLFELTLEKGRQSSIHYSLGLREDWYATDFYDNAFRRHQISRTINDAQSPVIFGDAARLAGHPSARSGGLADQVARLRR